MLPVLSLAHLLALPFPNQQMFTPVIPPGRNRGCPRGPVFGGSVSFGNIVKYPKAEEQTWLGPRVNLGRVLCFSVGSSSSSVTTAK